MYIVTGNPILRKILISRKSKFLKQDQVHILLFDINCQSVFNISLSGLHFVPRQISRLAFTWSKLTIETLEQGVNYV